MLRLEELAAGLLAEGAHARGADGRRRHCEVEDVFDERVDRQGEEGGNIGWNHSPWGLQWVCSRGMQLSKEAMIMYGDQKCRR